MAFTDPRVHPASADYYRMFPWEPIRSGAEIKVDNVVTINNMRMETLLEQIPAAVGSNGNLFIIFHGTDMGLSMRLAADTQVNADVRVMAVIDSDRTEVEAAQICMFPNPQTHGAQRIQTIRQKLRRVKDLRMASVELRACNTGQNTSHMQTIKNFFGCQSLGAPDIRDSFFTLNPSIPHNAQAEEHWATTHSRSRQFLVPANGRVSIAIQETGHSSFNTSMIVNSALAPSFWADVYLSRLHPHSVAMRPFPGHALFQTSASFPLIFPGEDDYTRHIIHV